MPCGNFLALKHPIRIADDKKETALPESRAAITVLAAEAADLAENLPDGAAIHIAAISAREEEHLADLLIRICLARTGCIVIIL